MANSGIPEPKQGMSTQKKWLIGCGGCLGVLLIIAIGLAALGVMGFNAFQGASSNAVSELFGKNFKTAPYMAVGLPLGQKNIKNMVMMIDKKQGTTVFGTNTELSPVDAEHLESNDTAYIQTFLQNLSKEATSSNSSRALNIQLDGINTVILPNGKPVPVSKATVVSKTRKKTVYCPAVAALIPEANQRLVTLVVINPKLSSRQEKTDFSSAQADLQQEVIRIIAESDLDDRLISTKAIKPLSN